MKIVTSSVKRRESTSNEREMERYIYREIQRDIERNREKRSFPRSVSRYSSTPRGGLFVFNLFRKYVLRATKFNEYSKAFAACNFVSHRIESRAI